MTRQAARAVPILAVQVGGGAGRGRPAVRSSTSASAGSAAPIDHAAGHRADAAIPFLPWTVWCYLPFYAGIFILTLAGLRTRRLFDRTLVGVLAVMLVGATGHLLVGGRIPAPAGAARPTPTCR